MPARLIMLSGELSSLDSRGGCPYVVPAGLESRGGCPYCCLCRSGAAEGPSVRNSAPLRLLRHTWSHILKEHSCWCGCLKQS